MNRTDLKVLAGPKENLNLHSLNGDVVTPLFHHLGSSSWHSFDGALVVLLGKPETQMRILFMGIIIGVAVVFRRRLCRAARDPLDGPVLLGYRYTNRKTPADVHVSRMA